MYINKLQLSGLRAFKQAEFSFQKGMNLLVGVNGVGKTTILEAIRVCLSKILPTATGLKMKKDSFRIQDIRIGARALQVSCDFEIAQKNFNLLIKKNKETYKGKDSGKPRDQGIEIQDIEDYTPQLSRLFKKESRSMPLALFFSTRRSHTVNQQQKSAISGQAAAFVDALSDSRDFNLRLMAEWYQAQQKLSEEGINSIRHVAAVNKAIRTFLPELTNPHVIKVDRQVDFRIDKNGIPLSAFQLSDGERGMLSLVTDLAKRLSQANPGLKDPLKDGQAVVLIDELDLHLHPKWQRTIVENLIRTFPACQFIATTHSPQIIPAVEPEQIQIVHDNEVLQPDRTKGMDTNWILKHLMETDERPADAAKFIEEVESLINKGSLKAARKRMKELKGNGYDLPDWSIFEARIARLELITKSK